MKAMIDKMHYILWKMYYAFLIGFFSLLPIKKNKVFITNYYGADFGDNGKYIAKELLKSDKEYDIVWQLKSELLHNNNLPEGIRGVKYYSPRAVFEMQTAAVWIDNARKVFGKKRNGQFYIQTWHGGPGLKRCEKDVENELAPSYVKHAKKDSAMCDIIVSNSDFMTRLFTESFWYNGKILRSGAPRNDIICKNSAEISRKVREFFALDKDVKILLYAPTFRKDGNLDVYDIDLEGCCEALSKRFSGEWKALLRLHPNISDKANEMSKSDKVIPATAYCDMQELLAAADCLITDYSSSIFDYSLSKKPCFIYASDIEDYREDRGYYFKFEELPFALASNNESMREIILQFDNDEFQENLERFSAVTGHKEPGNASATVAGVIEEFIWGN